MCGLLWLQLTLCIALQSAILQVNWVGCGVNWLLFEVDRQRVGGKLHQISSWKQLLDCAETANKRQTFYFCCVNMKIDFILQFSNQLYHAATTANRIQ